MTDDNAVIEFNLLPTFGQMIRQQSILGIDPLKLFTSKSLGSKSTFYTSLLSEQFNEK